jgi:hypothetical protein
MRYVVNTEIGLLGIWDEGALRFIKDKASYEEYLIKDTSLVGLMNEHHVAIWATGGDGKRCLDIRLNPEKDLDAEEEKLVIKKAGDMLLRIATGSAIIGSLEWAGTVQEEGLADEIFGVKKLKLKSGSYIVQVYWLPEGDVEYIVVIKNGESAKQVNELSRLG